MSIIIELEKIRINNDGKLKPVDVVKNAKNPQSPLHKYFVWDDTKAAHEYRLWQARELIKKIEITYEDGVVSQYVNVRIEQDQYYQKIDIALSNKNEWESAKQLLLTQIQAITANLCKMEQFAANENIVQKAKILTGKLKQLFS
jgi:hypothetical protein